MLQLVAIQFLLSVAVASESRVQNRTPAPLQIESYAILEENTAQDYCMSHGNFYCVTAQRFICVRAGMCITELELEVNSSINVTAVAGWCPFFPHETSLCFSPLNGYYQIPLTMSASELTNFTCNYYNRQGFMCSRCLTGYGPAVYSFSLMCAKCSDSGVGWVLYFVLTLLPITAFYFVIIMFNIRITSPPLTAFVFMCQTYIFIERLYVDLDMKFVLASKMYTGIQEQSLRFLIETLRILCGIWNLDFFRSVIPPFCVSSHLTNMQALFLEYVYVFYPLLLIIITCICIELHSRNFTPLIVVWKPFHKFFVRLQNTWDPTASVVNSFSTLMVLYSSKLLFVSSYTLYPTKLYYIHPLAFGFKKNDYREYFDPSNEIYSKHYWQYVSCSITFMIVFLVCPILLLCLYPIKVFRRLLHRLPLKMQLILYTFIDTFQGHYKDGTNGTRDYRFFSVVHLVFLALIVAFRTHMHYILYVTLPAQVICAVGSLLFAIARPCKRKYANIIQSLLMAMTAVALLTLIPSMSSRGIAYTSLLTMLICMLIPHIVFGSYIIYRITNKVNARYGFSIKILNSLRHDGEMVNVLPHGNTENNTTRDKHNHQEITPTESTVLLGSSSPST